MLIVLTVPVKLKTKLFREKKNTGCAHDHITERAVKFCLKHNLGIKFKGKYHFIQIT